MMNGAAALPIAGWISCTIPAGGRHAGASGSTAVVCGEIRPGAMSNEERSMGS